MKSVLQALKKKSDGAERARREVRDFAGITCWDESRLFPVYLTSGPSLPESWGQRGFFLLERTLRYDSSAAVL